MAAAKVGHPPPPLLRVEGDELALPPRLEPGVTLGPADVGPWGFLRSDRPWRTDFACRRAGPPRPPRRVGWSPPVAGRPSCPLAHRPGGFPRRARPPTPVPPCPAAVGGGWNRRTFQEIRGRRVLLRALASMPPQVVSRIVDGRLSREDFPCLFASLPPLAFPPSPWRRPAVSRCGCSPAEAPRPPPLGGAAPVGPPP